MTSVFTVPCSSLQVCSVSKSGPHNYLTETKRGKADVSLVFAGTQSAARFLYYIISSILSQTKTVSDKKKRPNYKREDHWRKITKQPTELVLWVSLRTARKGRRETLRTR